MKKYFIGFLLFGLLINNYCIAAELELSDVIREAREAAFLMKDNTDKVAEKTTATTTNTQQTINENQNIVKSSSTSTMQPKSTVPTLTKQQVQTSGEKNATEKIPAKSSFPLPKQ